ncbi:30961_t:CDS:2 [Gigaspora margarita]|uniref:30961_t:CDS:1 n=1 Tax=Gigaspora margarita TaxID=4874 RepID=A0ABN7UES0_GIGMA|nr:30961_t:CDS:2 [Gigaspora margarita]
MALLNSARIYSNNENHYESTIKQQANVNSFLQLNGIDTRICYLSFDDAVNESSNIQNETENRLYRTHSFIDVSETESIQYDEEGECSKFARKNNKFDSNNFDS